MCESPRQWYCLGLHSQPLASDLWTQIKSLRLQLTPKDLKASSHVVLSNLRKINTGVKFLQIFDKRTDFSAEFGQKLRIVSVRSGQVQLQVRLTHYTLRMEKAHKVLPLNPPPFSQSAYTKHNAVFHGYPSMKEKKDHYHKMAYQWLTVAPEQNFEKERKFVWLQAWDINDRLRPWTWVEDPPVPTQSGKGLLSASTSQLRGPCVRWQTLRMFREQYCKSKFTDSCVHKTHIEWQSKEHITCAANMPRFYCLCIWVFRWRTELMYCT